MSDQIITEPMTNAETTQNEASAKIAEIIEAKTDKKKRQRLTKLTTRKMFLDSIEAAKKSETAFKMETDIGNSLDFVPDNAAGRRLRKMVKKGIASASTKMGNDRLEVIAAYRSVLRVLSVTDSAKLYKICEAFADQFPIDLPRASEFFAPLGGKEMQEITAELDGREEQAELDEMKSGAVDELAAIDEVDEDEDESIFEDADDVGENDEVEDAA